jgi:hypothetical protein
MKNTKKDNTPLMGIRGLGGPLEGGLPPLRMASGPRFGLGVDMFFCVLEESYVPPTLYTYFTTQKVYT